MFTGRTRMGVKIQQGQIGNVVNTMPVFTGKMHGNCVSGPHNRKMIQCKGEEECPFCCCPCPSDDAMQSFGLPELLEWYCEKCRPLMQKYLALYREIQCDQWLEAAAKAYCPRCRAGKHPHQRRIPRAVLEEFHKKLSGYTRKLKNAADFDELLGVVTQAKIPGIGDLACYDAALRIGAHFDKLPERTVYLHAKARIPGSLKIITVGRDRFHEAFSEYQMTAYEIEDFLCRFHKHLKEKGIPILKNQK